jgi:5'-3' exonuclease, C-terminal SAM fold
MLALCGDASDNVPGVRGIGPKTAAPLLQQFGDVEGVLAAAAQVQPLSCSSARNHGIMPCPHLRNVTTTLPNQQCSSSVEGALVAAAAGQVCWKSMRGSIHADWRYTDAAGITAGGAMRWSWRNILGSLQIKLGCCLTCRVCRPSGRRACTRRWPARRGSDLGPHQM